MPQLSITSSTASSRDMPNRGRRDEALVTRRQAGRRAVRRGGVLSEALLRLLQQRRDGQGQLAALRQEQTQPPVPSLPRSSA
jgi:hypothetical protein